LAATIYTHGEHKVKNNYVLIDYENVQPDYMAALNIEHFHVLVFVGANQTKVSYEVASVLQEMGNRAEYIKISSNGSNALDFQIAYYIGKIAADEPEAYFHIISKDSGFDPLIQHLKSKKVHASRVKSVSEIPLVKISNSKLPSEKASAVMANLKQRGASKPRTLKTLSSTINSLFQKSLNPQEIAIVIEEMRLQKVISINDNKVVYI
jgi:PIN domain